VRYKGLSHFKEFLVHCGYTLFTGIPLRLKAYAAKPHPQFKLDGTITLFLDNLFAKITGSN
jgi:hypothetical protein